MEILFYRYGSICEPEMISGFKRFGIDVVEDKRMITDKAINSSEIVKDVAALIDCHSFMFVFSVNFFPALSEICELRSVPYVCWSVDCPVKELLSPSLSNSCNRVFLFDRNQYLYFKEKNPEGIFHLPLASSPSSWEKAINSASPDMKKKFSSDVSFVGSLYSEKNPYRKIQGLSDYAKGYADGIIEAQLLLYGFNFLEKKLDETVMEEYRKCVPGLHDPYTEGKPPAQRYEMAAAYLGAEAAERERERLLAALGLEACTDLYTYSPLEGLKKECERTGAPVRKNGDINSPGINVHEGVKTLTEMPIVFHESRINLNITMRSISSGLSQRVFDICACGGFLMCNYQEELPELFEPGEEVEVFSSKEELLDKTAWYLEHEEERKKIAERGLERVLKEHTWDMRIASLIKTVYGTL
jgi:spore maturation protein CgeB